MECEAKGLKPSCLDTFRECSIVVSTLEKRLIKLWKSILIQIRNSLGSELRHFLRIVIVLHSLHRFPRCFTTSDFGFEVLIAVVHIMSDLTS